jgi:hypothetical protein
MNKKILCAIPLSLLVVACGHQEVTTVAGCVKRPATEHCEDTDPGGTTPFVNVTPNGWVVAPTNVCVTAGDTLEIRFPGSARTLNTIATMPYGNAEFWLIGSNSSHKNTITLTVPAGPKKGDSFDYAILSKSDGCVDPRITYK